MYISVDIVSETVYLLDKLAKMKNDLFHDPTAYTLAQKVLKTLIRMISGPSFKNQRLLGQWKKLHKILNMFICQDLQNFAPITDERRAKIDLFCLSVNLLQLILK